MLNSAPNNSKYNQGNYIPKYKDKLVKLNSQGGVYFRSSLEKRLMLYLDHNEKITRWGAECMKVNYQRQNLNGDGIKNHTYYPDFYYELRDDQGVLKQVVVEVKPMKDYKMVQMLREKKLKVPEKGLKKLKNFEYDLKEAYKNKCKWDAMIKWCNKKGYKFIIITEEHLKKFNV
jgi:hypothetical protein